MNKLAQATLPPDTTKYVKPSEAGVIGNGPTPHVPVAGPPFTLVVRPSKFEHPQPFTGWLVRKQIAPFVLKLPDWLVNVTGFVHGEPPPVPVNVAVTDRAAVIATVHVPVPVQAPLQPANVEPAAGAAVSVTDVPSR